MRAWTALTLEQTALVCNIPLETLRATNARCFERTDAIVVPDGPWEIILFTHEPPAAELLTIAIMTFDGEYLDLPDFEPFFAGGGHLSLTHDDLTDLIALLEAEAATLPAHLPAAEPVFRSLTEADLTTFHLHPEWFTESMLPAYQQIPLPIPGLDEIVTLLLLQRDDRSHAETLAFQIMRFPHQALHDADFMPLDHAHARITLDQTVCHALIGLLRSYL